MFSVLPGRNVCFACGAKSAVRIYSGCFNFLSGFMETGRAVKNLFNKFAPTPLTPDLILLIVCGRVPVFLAKSTNDHPFCWESLSTLYQIISSFFINHYDSKNSLQNNSLCIIIPFMELKTYISKHGDGIKFARKLGIHHVYFNAIKNHRRKPSPPLALRIQQATGGAVTVMELLFPDKADKAAS